MAIKASNQITFTEQKKILKIKEWYLATAKDSGVTRDPKEGWTEEVQVMNETDKYLWNYEEVIYSIGSSEKSEPIIIGFYGKGTEGKGVANIKNYYFTTQNPELPENPDWSDTVLMLTPTDKYLWNYEEFIYTDGSSKPTDPAIIGVYGDSGSGSVDFQIYSVDGFEFNDNLTSIELKTIAFKDGQELNDDDISYQWKWWNGESELSDKYEDISGATFSTLLVNSTDVHAFTSLKCEMLYDNIVYEDYVSFTKSSSVYTAIAKFWDGNNIISDDKDYLIMYVELFKDNNQEERLRAEKIILGNNNVQDNIISTDSTLTFSDGNMAYFVCHHIFDNEVEEYDVVLGEYMSGKWHVVNNDYIYENDLFSHTNSPVVYVPKNKVSRSLTINFTIKQDEKPVARTSAMVLDFNDPIIGKEPSDKKDGMLWLDTETNILKMWDGSKWVNSGYQNGNVVYTSFPNKYSSGDLWILEKQYGNYAEGTMIKATRSNSNVTSFISDDWEDADIESTKQKNNIKQYFVFDPIKGLTIGQSTEKFYVNISATRMGFCERPGIDVSSEEEYIDQNEVVSISNSSATIRNLTVNDGAIFNCEIKFGGFVLKTESDGSLSLALST